MISGAAKRGSTMSMAPGCSPTAGSHRGPLAMSVRSAGDGARRVFASVQAASRRVRERSTLCLELHVDVEACAQAVVGRPTSREPPSSGQRRSSRPGGSGSVRGSWLAVILLSVAQDPFRLGQRGLVVDAGRERDRSNLGLELHVDVEAPTQAVVGRPTSLEPPSSRRLPRGWALMAAPEAPARTLAWPVSPDRHEPGPLERFGCATPECIGGLAGIAAGDVG